MKPKFTSKSSVFLVKINTIILATIVIASTFSLVAYPALGAQFILKVNQEVFVSGEKLIVYGKTEPNDVLLVRLFDPAGKTVRLDNVPTDKDGFFREEMLEWPEPSINLPFGNYVIEANSSIGSKSTQQLAITFAEKVLQGNETAPAIPVIHNLEVKLDSPAQVSTGKLFRIFVQVTYDNALVDADPEQLLGYSHVHADNQIINIAKFKALHPGLDYADVQLDKDGTYVIHVQAFYKGILSHDSKVVIASASSINSIQDSVNELNKQLNSTNQELGNLDSKLLETKSTVENVRKSIGEDIESVRDASGQLNSLVLPVLALISVIIALQISLFARIRASYR